MVQRLECVYSIFSSIRQMFDPPLFLFARLSRPHQQGQRPHRLEGVSKHPVYFETRPSSRRRVSKHATESPRGSGHRVVLCQARLGLKATGFGLACTGFRPGKPQAKPGARRSGRAPAWLWLGPRLLAPNASCGGADGLGLQ